MELHQCLRWVESQSETPILVVLSALLRNFYWYGINPLRSVNRPAGFLY
jgi:hypothetical protein